LTILNCATDRLSRGGAAVKKLALRVCLRKTGLISGSCEPSGQHPDIGDEDPSHHAFKGGFEVLGQAAAASKPACAAGYYGLGDP
jgi:hypothetical protein